ncbi:glycosyltransferase family 4 protein [Pseudothermotoga sp.]|uniref:glycosyltransferase family 4 protein n=1 Tax=Pseudothermotoga sp. TaxID=2033661 RepID=UPI0031F6BD13
MRIAMFTETYIPQRNGVATSVFLYKRALEERGHQVYVVTTVGDNSDDIFVLKSSQFKYESNHVIPLDGRLLPVLDFVRNKAVEVIHSHAPFALGLRALAAQKYLKLPHVHTYHTLLVEYRHYIPKPLTPSKESVAEFSAWFCNMVNHIIAPTENIKQELVHYGIVKPIHVIPTGIDVDSFEKSPSFDVRHRHGISKNTKLLLYVGRLAKEKNVAFLLHVLKNLLDRKNDVHLILVGDGPERTQLEEEAKQLEVEDRVTFTGAIARETLVNYYRQADVFTFASTTETQGLVVLESLASGTPVVAVAKMGVANVLKDGEGAFLLKEVNLQEFTDKIELLLSDPKLSDEMKLKGKAYVKKHWSIQKTVEELEKVYQMSISEGAVEVEYYSSVWLEIMIEKMKQISSKIFTAGGGRRVTFAPFSRTRSR